MYLVFFWPSNTNPNIAHLDQTNGSSSWCHCGRTHDDSITMWVGQWTYTSSYYHHLVIWTETTCYHQWSIHRVTSVCDRVGPFDSRVSIEAGPECPLFEPCHAGFNTGWHARSLTRRSHNDSITMWFGQTHHHIKVLLGRMRKCWRCSLHWLNGSTHPWSYYSMVFVTIITRIWAYHGDTSIAESNFHGATLSWNHGSRSGA